MGSIRLLLGLALAALLLGGCGGDDDEGGSAPEALEGEAAATAIADAATKTTTYDGGVEATLDLAVAGTGPSDTSLGLDANIDAATETGEIVIDAANGAYTVRLGQDAAWITSDDAAFTDSLPDGAEWVEVAPDELAGIGVDTSFDEGGLTPQMYLALGATDVVAGEQSEVNGVPVQTYSFGIDQDAAVEAAPEEAKERVETAITLEGENQSIEGEAAIDGEGYMREMNVVGSAEALDFASFEVSFDVQYLDFGVDVPAEAPDPATVVPLSEAPEAGAALQGALAG